MKGQSSIEFLSLVTMSMIVLASLYTFMAAKQQDTLNFREERSAESIAEKSSFQVEMALVQREGYSRVFTLPGGINGNDYSVEIGEGSIVVDWQESDLYRLSRYQGRPINFSVDSDTRVFKVLHNSTGVYVVEG